MTRMADGQQEIFEATRREVWSLKGPNQIVKVLASGGTVASKLGGYFTIGRYLLGKTPQQIETSLGLPDKHLVNGARIYRFIRLPHVGEYEYELTAHYPSGLAYIPAHSHPGYLPGDRAIHQWRIKKDIEVPVDTINFLDLKPGQMFPYNWLQPS